MDLSQSSPQDLFKDSMQSDQQSQGSGDEQTPDGTDDVGSDAEGVWAPDIEQAFQEALAIYPPCGRRKIILSDEGKMYGRNELIARYIKLRTGKSRTRKQVSSHIQVLARKKAREIQGKIKDQAAKEKALQGLSTMSSAQIVSASAMTGNRMFSGTPGITGNAVPMHTMLQGGHGGLVVKHELLNPATGLIQQIWHPSMSPSSKQGFVISGSPPSSQLQVAGAPGPFMASVQSQGEGMIQVSSPTHMDGMKIAVPYGIPSQEQAISIPNIPPPNLPLKMVEFVAFAEQIKTETNNNPEMHRFIHITPSTSFVDPTMEAVDIRHIADKFPEKNGGLKDLFEKGPQDRFFLIKFWADINTTLLDDTTAFYGVTSQYESSENMTISCSTKVCSFGKQVVEKVETEYSRFDSGRFIYRINRSTMCDYMVSFILRLKHLPEKYMMNSVLENFTILQVVTNRDTQETLLCLAYVFEVCTDDSGPKHHVYRLIREC
eukprot:Em0021g265a